VSASSFFEPSSFLADFISALGRRGRCRPIYPERSWWHCLAEAERLDDLRRRNAAQLALDATEYYAPRVTYVERLHGSTAARMNGEVLHLAALSPDK
jgi:hypothetical protein